MVERKNIAKKVGKVIGKAALVVAGGAFIVGSTLSAISCDHEDYSCKCASSIGKDDIVLDTDELCGQRDCKNKNKEVLIGERLQNGIPVTNPNSVHNFDDVFLEVTGAITNKYLTATQKTYINTNIKEIRIVTGDANPPAFLSDGVLTVGSDMFLMDILVALDEWLTDNEIAMLQMQKAIRMATVESARDVVRTAVRQPVDTKQFASQVAFQLVGNSRGRLIDAIERDAAQCGKGIA
jgi:hypothetical protein